MWFFTWGSQRVERNLYAVGSRIRRKMSQFQLRTDKVADPRPSPDCSILFKNLAIISYATLRSLKIKNLLVDK